MRIPLNLFEQYIEETILKRGLSYFKKGYVNEPEEITQGVYEAIVNGSDDYKVKLTITKGIITDYSCNCPFDMGPVCKHVAAVLFYIQQDVLDVKQEVSSQKVKKQNKKSKSKNVDAQVNDLLEKISHEELKQFVFETTKHNPPFKNLFLSSFAYQNPGETKEHYMKQIKSILRAYDERDGFINRSGARNICRSVGDLLNTANRHLENKNYMSVIFICSAVMEEMIKAIQYADDSDGNIGGNINIAFDILYNLSLEELNEDMRKLLFEYCLWTFKKRIFSGWDWDLELLSLAVNILKNEEEASKITTLLDEVQWNKFYQEKALNIKLQIMKSTKGETEADKFIEENIAVPSFRKIAIEKSMKSKNYDYAITLAKDGIKSDKEEYPGLAKIWYDWLLKIAVAQNDNEKIIEYARYLFIDNFIHEQDYYLIMKNNVHPDNWHSFLEGIISDNVNKSRWTDIHLIAGIYIKEEWWSRLFELVKQNPSIQIIEYYEKYLSKDYASELSQLYESEIIKFLKLNTGRNHYKTACRYLRRMIKLGSREKVDKMIIGFKDKYRLRKALVDELNKV